MKLSDYVRVVLFQRMPDSNDSGGFGALDFIDDSGVEDYATALGETVNLVLVVDNAGNTCKLTLLS